MIADPGCRLLECDFSGIEARQVGWFARDPAYLYLSALGVHAYLASHLLNRPADISWPTDQLVAYLKATKKSDPVTYDKAKRCIHGVGYDLTEWGLHLTYPELFPTLADARHVRELFFSIAPMVKDWQNATKLFAAEHGFLGGPGRHPYGYKHYFYGVFSYEPMTEGEYSRWRYAKQHGHRAGEVVFFHGRPYKVRQGDDAKRSVAFYPQSTAAGNIKEAALLLFIPSSPWYIGDAYYGRTPLRAIIHDSFLLEVPVRAWDRVLEAVALVMQMPIVAQPLDWVSDDLKQRYHFGSHLQIGIEAKASAIGGNWKDMSVVPHPTEASILPFPTIDDYAVPIDNDEDEELIADLETKISHRHEEAA